MFHESIVNLSNSAWNISFFTEVCQYYPRSFSVYFCQRVHEIQHGFDNNYLSEYSWPCKLEAAMNYPFPIRVGSYTLVKVSLGCLSLINNSDAMIALPDAETFVRLKSLCSSYSLFGRSTLMRMFSSQKSKWQKVFFIRKYSVLWNIRSSPDITDFLMGLCCISPTLTHQYCENVTYVFGSRTPVDFVAMQRSIKVMDYSMPFQRILFWVHHMAVLTKNR